MTSQLPLVTVYIPSRNYGRYLAQAIASVRSQLHTNWELFLIDEASEDETASVAEHARAQDPARIRVIRHERPEGLQRVANKVLGLAEGRYIVRLDADDWLDEAALLLMAAKLESDSELGLVYGNYYYADAAGRVIGFERRRALGAENATRHEAPHGACTMVRTRTLRAVGGYAEDVDAQDGWDLWHKVLRVSGAASLEAPIFYYRQHESSLSRDNDRILSARGRIVSKARELGEGSYRPSCLAVIPVRESFPGFEGVPYREIAGRSLLELAIRAAQGSAAVTEVAVSSASTSVLDFAERLVSDARVRPHARLRRPDEAAGARIHLREVLAQAAESYRVTHGAAPDIVVFLSIHAPLRRSEHIDKAVDTLRVHVCDSVVSVCEEVEPVFAFDRDGLRLLNPGRFDDLAYERERLFRFNGAVLAIWGEVLSRGELFGARVGSVEMTRDESLQVKRPHDVEALAVYASTSGRTA